VRYDDDKNPNIGAIRQSQGTATIGTDNVACFLSYAGYAALVPGPEDFYFDPERLRMLARFMAGIKKSAQYGPVQMLAANLAVKTSWAWYRQTPYHAPTDWVFATDNNRAGAKRGKQPLWLCKVMGYHIQPISRKLGITKRIGWPTFRRTYSSILQDNGEDVKVVQELLRHASTKVTLDVYAQALTPTKRAAQRKVVQMIRGESRCTAGVPREIGTSV
jgi:hypothetical protein